MMTSELSPLVPKRRNSSRVLASTSIVVFDISLFSNTLIFKVISIYSTYLEVYVHSGV